MPEKTARKIILRFFTRNDKKSLIFIIILIFFENHVIDIFAHLQTEAVLWQRLDRDGRVVTRLTPE
jgi:hypothetical protein